jgi:hypothetical protein
MAWLRGLRDTRALSHCSDFLPHRRDVVPEQCQGVAAAAVAAAVAAAPVAAAVAAAVAALAAVAVAAAVAALAAAAVAMLATWRSGTDGVPRSPIAHLIQSLPPT